MKLVIPAAFYFFFFFQTPSPLGGPLVKKKKSLSEVGFTVSGFCGPIGALSRERISESLSASLGGIGHAAQA